MKFSKTILPTVGLLAASFVFPLSTLADSPTFTTVSGVVKDASNNPDKGVIINVTCNGHSHGATSKADGSYQVVFSSADACAVGDTATVTGSKGTASGGGSGTVNNAGTFGDVVLDFAVVNFSVPEFSTMLGLFAGFVGLGTFFTLKKRNA